MVKSWLYLVLLVCATVYSASDTGTHINLQQIQIGGVPTDRRDFSLEWPPKSSSMRTVWYVLGGTYVLTSAYMLYTRYMLNNLNAWNNWRNNISLADLASMPQKNVYEMLSKSIQTRYHCPPGTTMMNITRFLQETSDEIDHLNNYISFANMAQGMRLHWLFFISRESIKQAEEKIKRLHFMQSVVASELEPDNGIRQLNIINYSNRTRPSLMQRVLGRHR